MGRKGGSPETSGPRSQLSIGDTLRTASTGPRSRKLRSALSALGITIGIAALVSVLGLSSSSSADLIRELDALGTNLLTVEAGQSFGSGNSSLPVDAPARIRRIDPVYEVAAVSKIGGGVYRSDLIEEGRTQGLTIIAADLNLLDAQQGSISQGQYLTSALQDFPTVVLGSVAAERLGVTELTTARSIWLGEEWFVVVGILNPLPLAADLDRAAIIGYPAAAQYLDYEYEPDIIYVRARAEHVLDVRSVMSATVNPEKPEEVEVSRASDVLEARAAAESAFTNLFLGLGVVALLVGGIGIANVMVIAVIERRNEIGLRRALGATRFHIAMQFLTESFFLSAAGGFAGVMLGIGVTVVYAMLQDWAVVIPSYALFGGFGSSLLIGGLAGLYPSLRAASMSPTEALRTR